MSTTLAPEATLPDLGDPETFADAVPLETFRALRERPGLYWQASTLPNVNGGYWAVTRFEDIVAIEKEPATFTSRQGAAFPMMSPTPTEFPMSEGLMSNDPPRHSSLRRVAATGFGPRIVANFEPWIRDIVREAIDSVDGLDEFDFVEKFCRTIPAYVIARVLGSPKEDRQDLVDWTIALFVATQQQVTDAGMSHMVAAMGAMHAYAAKIQAIKRDAPADDMFTALGAAVDRGELTQPEFLQWMSLMMGAGFETTHTAIGQAMRMYLEHDEIREASDRAIDEGRGDQLAGEYIRLITPAMQMARTATRDAEIAGTAIRKGDVVVNYFVSANRDAAVFSEPDTFNPWRTETATLAFGSGPHRCIGSYLAKLEVRIVFEELRAQQVRLRLNGQPKRGWSNFINQISELPVALVR